MMNDSQSDLIPSLLIFANIIQGIHTMADDSPMKTIVLASLIITSALTAYRGEGAETDYTVDWPAIHLAGRFTLDVPSQFGTYFATDALGTYGGLEGTYSVVWTAVRLDAGPSRTDLTFIWDQGYTGFLVTPAYVGRPSPWTSADQAWADLRTAPNGVSITVVPEPSTTALMLVFGLAVCGFMGFH